MSGTERKVNKPSPTVSTQTKEHRGISELLRCHINTRTAVRQSWDIFNIKNRIPSEKYKNFKSFTSWLAKKIAEVSISILQTSPPAGSEASTWPHVLLPHRQVGHPSPWYISIISEPARKSTSGVIRKLAKDLLQHSKTQFLLPYWLDGVRKTVKMTLQIFKRKKCFSVNTNSTSVLTTLINP